MTHLSMEQLLATREPGLEPQVRNWRDHIEICAVCRAELDRLDQRVARLRALPGLRPSRDLFGAVRLKAAADRRAKQVRRVVLGGMALAASVAFAAFMINGRPDHRTLVAADPELAEMMSQSQGLEQALSGFDQDRQVVDGRAVAVTSSLEDQLARVDRQLEAVGMLEAEARQIRMIKLWRERVGLLDALVDVHLTGARYVGF
ncbi:MAG: hypothetical protein EXR94_10080 [Gemmatimonadetes bacterium]|nr:hypothetical protein [Gemmatimonadota bacterium]